MSNVPRISLKNTTGEIVISSIPDSVQNYDFESTWISMLMLNQGKWRTSNLFGKSGENVNVIMVLKNYYQIYCKYCKRDVIKRK